MIEQFEILDGELNEDEKVRLEQLGLQSLVKVPHRRAHIKFNLSSSLNYNFSLPVFYIPHINFIADDHERVNASVATESKTPRRAFGVFHSKEHKAILKSAAIPLPVNIQDSSDQAVAFNQSYLGLEVGWRNLNHDKLKLPSVRVEGFVRVPFPRGLLYGIEEKGKAIKYMEDPIKQKLLENIESEARAHGYRLFSNDSNPYKDIYKFGDDSSTRVLAGGWRTFDRIKK